jgi:outer membrane protein OmpA-like peptidoglycan-associated protein
MSLNTFIFTPSLPSRLALASVMVITLGLSMPVQAQNPQGEDQTLDVGSSIPDATAVKEGLFPDDACQELRASGFKCMGFKPAVKYSLPASSFALGSSVVPALLKRQLDVFVEVLRGKSGSERKVRIIGHADASGSQAGNLNLSRRRAESVRDYLVQQGVSPSLLIADGLGSKEPKNKTDPFSAENRRVEIGRSNPPR